MQIPFDDHWRRILQQNFPLYRRLPNPLKKMLEAHIHVFVDEKLFVGCDGMDITDRVRVLIAAQACILVVNKQTDYFPGFETILVYPSTFKVPVVEYDGLVQSASVSARSGESWHRGPVVLAWDQVLDGAHNSGDGHNVVMHEFAHKLDEETEAMNGLPRLSKPSQYQSWSKVLSAEYQKLLAQLEAGDEPFLGDYAALSPAEFFAVITEYFFERPKELRRLHRALYGELSDYYLLNPIEWA